MGERIVRTKRGKKGNEEIAMMRKGGEKEAKRIANETRTGNDRNQVKQGDREAKRKGGEGRGVKRRQKMV